VIQVYLIENGLSPYRDAWSLQQKLFDYATGQRNTHFLLLTEHDPVITIGKSGTLKNLLARPEYLKQHQIDLVEIDRGGDITFHGPGQLVGYPVLDLSSFKKDVHWYLRMLEEVIIRTLKTFGLTAGRAEGLTGVWVNDAKICAMGIKVTRWITMHGFALNVNTDLKYFQHIVPCGINDKSVTSISRLVGNKVDLKHVIKELVDRFEQVFQVTCVPLPKNLLSLSKIQE
jgi:lipoyl(octanoyl) transferase